MTPEQIGAAWSDEFRTLLCKIDDDTMLQIAGDWTEALESGQKAINARWTDIPDPIRLLMVECTRFVFAMEVSSRGILPPQKETCR